jgi:hypothetical protein
MVDGYGFRYRKVDDKTAKLEAFGNVNIQGLDVDIDRDVKFRAAHNELEPDPTNASLFLEADAISGAGGSLEVEGSLEPNVDYGEFPDQVLGIVAAMVLFCAAMPVAWGARRWAAVIGFAVLFPAAVYTVFAIGLSVYFEPGLLAWF